MNKLGLAQSYVYDAYNDADHANQLLCDVRVALDAGEIDRALEYLQAAEKPADMLPSRIRWARDAIEAAQKETTGGDPTEVAS